LERLALLLDGVAVAVLVLSWSDGSFEDRG